MQSEKILELKELHISFTQYTRGLQRRTIENVCGLSFSTYAGEVTALVGASGSGKSLLAHAVMGLLPYNASMDGEIFYRERLLEKEQIEQLRGSEILLVPQGASYLDPLMKSGAQILKGSRDPQKKTKLKEIFQRYHLKEDAAALYPHVARAAGIATADQRDKISVLISPFYQADEPVLPVPEGIPAWVIYAAAGGGVLFLVLLLVILLLGRRRRKRRKELEAAGLAAVAQTETAPLTPQEGADIMNLQTEKSMELRKDVRKFAEDNPEIAAQMVKSWLREGDCE